MVAFSFETFEIVITKIRMCASYNIVIFPAIITVLLLLLKITYIKKSIVLLTHLR